MNTKNLAILNLVSLIITLAVNYSSNTGMINGNTMSTVSRLYDNLFTPASYAFSIWGVIYLFLSGFVIYSLLAYKKPTENRIITKIGLLFPITCMLNSLWIFAWLNDYLAISVVLMILLLATLIKILLTVKKEVVSSGFRTAIWFYWPFSLYTGWISVAFVANIAAFLTKTEWNGWNISDEIWTVIMVAVAGVVNLLMVWKEGNNVFAVVGVWALAAVAVSNSDTNTSVYYTALITAIIIALNIVVHLIRNKTSKFFIQE